MKLQTILYCSILPLAGTYGWFIGPTATPASPGITHNSEELNQDIEQITTNDAETLSVLQELSAHLESLRPKEVQRPVQAPIINEKADPVPAPEQPALTLLGTVIEPRRSPKALIKTDDGSLVWARVGDRVEGGIVTRVESRELDLRVDSILFTYQIVESP